MQLPIDIAIPFDRITWRDGQRLTARDLNDSETELLRRRWLHHLFLHDAAEGNWGIVAGYEVAMLSSADSLAVQSGYAIDPQGRELILAQNMVLPVPANSTGWLVLVIRYQDMSTYCVKPEARCEGGVLGSKQEFPAFVWLNAVDFKPSQDIALAAVQVSAGIVTPPVITSLRRKARPVLRYKLRSDFAPAFQTYWEAGEIPGGGGLNWFQTTVDTSEAGFVTTPQYFAQLLDSAGNAVSPLAATLLEIRDASPTQFTLRVFAGFNEWGLPQDSNNANGGWSVSWVGYEPDPPPKAGALSYLHLSGVLLSSIEFAK